MRVLNHGEAESQSIELEEASESTRLSLPLNEGLPCTTGEPAGCLAPA